MRIYLFFLAIAIFISLVGFRLNQMEVILAYRKSKKLVKKIRKSNSMRRTRGTKIR